jgi:N-acetylglutamate synthase-like GNAT family acetyltransferase
MGATGLQVVARHDLDGAAVEERLYEFNMEATGYRDGLDLGFVVEDAGEMVAAAAGYTWGGICEVKTLWVHPDRRGSGLGSALMARAIEEARARECRLLFLATYDFQAPDFYARLGFECIATIPDKPLGHVEHIMRLKLT